MTPPPSYGSQWLYWDHWATYHQQFSRALILSHQESRDTNASPSNRRKLSRIKRLGWTKAAPSDYHSSFSPDKMIMPPPPSRSDNFHQFQDFIKWVADSSQISLEEVEESQQKLFDILHSTLPSRVGFPINETLLKPAKAIWQTPATVTPTCKR